MDKDEKDRSWKCSWDGDVSTFQDYVRRVRLAFSRTKKKHRKHLAAELVGQLTGRAWTVTQEISHERLVKDDGAKYLVLFLEERLARIPVPDAGSRAEELFVRLRRPAGMSMSSWCSLVRESYRQLQRALKRARPMEEPVKVISPSSPKAPSTSPPSSMGRSGRRSSKRTMAEPEADDVEAEDVGSPSDEGDEDEDPPSTLAGRKGKGKKAESSSSDDDDMQWAVKLWDEMDSSLPEVLPTELLGWLILRRSGLSAQQRLNILSSVNHSLKADDVEKGLRGAEEELRHHEREQDGRGKGKGGFKSRPKANFWIEQEGEGGLLALDDADAQEWAEEGQIHWVGRDVSAVYAASSMEDRSTSKFGDNPSVSDGQGFWH